MDSKRIDPLDEKMPSKKKQPQIPLPKSWDKYVKSGILHVFALAQYALIYSRRWAADSSNQRAGLKVERNRWEQEVALVHEAMRIKDARMAQLAPQPRPKQGRPVDSRRVHWKPKGPKRASSDEAIQTPRYQQGFASYRAGTESRDEGEVKNADEKHHRNKLSRSVTKYATPKRKL